MPTLTDPAAPGANDGDPNKAAPPEEGGGEATAAAAAAKPEGKLSAGPFPQRLREMLSNESENVVRWLPKGIAFVIVQKDAFVAALPKYFRMTQIAAFQKQLRTYGFNKITKGRGAEGAYHHPLFHRDKPELQRKMKSGTGPEAEENKKKAAKKEKKEVPKKQEKAQSKKKASKPETSNRQKKWAGRFAELEAWKKEHGNCDVPEKENPRLHEWCKYQRTKAKEETLPAEHAEKLDGLGFYWGFKQGEEKEAEAERWHARLQEWKDYTAKSGGKIPATEKRLYCWMKNQRYAHKRGKLPEERVAALKEAGFAFAERADEYEALWETKFAELSAYREEHGDCKVKRGTGGKLALWVDQQRTRQKKGKLDPERHQRLESLGFTWGTVRANPEERLPWTERYDQLVAFKREHGHMDVPKTDPRYQKLNTWCAMQRVAKSKGKMLEERAAKLDEINFRWSGKPQRGPVADEAWDTRFSQLQTFKAQHGSLEVPGKGSPYFKLYDWCKAQRRRKKEDRLSEDRLRRLEELGFDFVKERTPRNRKVASLGGGAGEDVLEDINIPVPPGQLGMTVEFGDGPGALITGLQPTCSFQDKVDVGDRLVSIDGRRVRSAEDLSGSDRQRVFGFVVGRQSRSRAPKPPSAGWESRFAELKQFGEANGHYNFPPGAHMKVREWIQKQRYYYRNDELSEEKKARFEGIGFDLAAGRSLPTFDEWMGRLSAYSAQFGNCNVPISYTTLGLGKWVWRQRDFYKKLTLPDERIVRLEAAGFDWQVNSWDDRIAMLQLYREKNGSANPPQTHAALGNWAKTIRDLHRKKELSEECVASLAAVGFNLSTTRGRGSNPASWASQYELLRQYYQEHGNSHAPRSHPQLGTWIDYQRKAHKKGRLTQEQVQALEALQFNFGAIRQKTTDASWREQYNELLAYQQEHGHCDVPQSTTGLGRFVHWQRCIYKKGKISQERVELLNAIGFRWIKNPSVAMPRETFDNRFAELQATMKETGQAPARKTTLGRWLERQRARMAEGKLSTTQSHCLTELGFTPLQVTKRSGWNEQFDRLQSQVVNLDDEMTKFVALQQRYYRAGTLSQERADRLMAIGVDLDKPVKEKKADSEKKTKKKSTPSKKKADDDETWELMFGQLASYKEQHGDCKVKQRSGELSLWVDMQRTRKRRGKLDPEREQRLDSIGFHWPVPLTTPRERVPWEKRFAELVEYKKEHGTLVISKADAKLSQWCATQRRAKKQGYISEEHAAKLDEIGFQWVGQAGQTGHVDPTTKKGGWPKKRKKSATDEEGTLRLIACGECEGCEKKACGECDACTGSPKKRCLDRECTSKMWVDSAEYAAWKASGKTTPRPTGPKQRGPKKRKTGGGKSAPKPKDQDLEAEAIEAEEALLKAIE